MSILNKGVGEKFRWYYPVAGAIIGTALVISNAWSVFYPYIMAQFGIDSTLQASVSLGASMVGFGNMVVAPIVGAIIADKVGPKIMYLLSIILGFIGLMLLRVMATGEAGQWDDFKMYWYIGSFLIGWSIGCYTASANPCAVKWCADKPGLASGFVQIGPALGPVWCTLAATALIPQLGIAGAFTVLVVGSSIVTLIFGVILSRNPEPGWLPEGYVRPDVTAGQDGLTLAQAMKKKEFWCLAACIFLVCFAGFCFAMNMSTIVVEGVGADIAVAGGLIALTMSVANIVNAVARLFWGWVSSKIGGLWASLKILYIGFIVALLLFSFIYKTPAGAFVGIIIVYIFFGGTSPLHQASGPALFGPKYAGQLQNSLLVLTGIGWTIGPYIGGFIKGATGSYVGALYLGVAALVIAVAIVFYIQSQAKKQKAVEAE